MNRRNFVVAAICFVCWTCTSSGPTVVNELTVPGVTGSFSFDIAQVDSGKLYLADRTNKALDVWDTKSYQLLGQIKGTGATAFAGVGASNDTSGPDGVVVIPGANTVYVGDVNSVKVVDTSAMSITKTILLTDPTTNTPTGNRADEGCYDGDDKLMMFNHPADGFASFISTTTQTRVATFTFPGTLGLEACIYDPTTKNFFVNNDGNSTNPNGELDVIPAASVVAGAPAISKSYGLGDCGPTGMDLGPGNDLVIGCDPSGAATGAPVGTPIVTLILDKTNGSKLASVPLGGVDEVVYDKVTNRYFLSARRWQTGGTWTGTMTFAPSFGIIDAGSRSVVTRLDAGNNDHSVAVDGALHRAFVAHSNQSSLAIPASGVTVYSTE
jgi:hypothetical protein